MRGNRWVTTLWGNRSLQFIDVSSSVPRVGIGTLFFRTSRDLRVSFHRVRCKWIPTQERHYRRRWSLRLFTDVMDPYR